MFIIKSYNSSRLTHGQLKLQHLMPFVVIKKITMQSGSECHSPEQKLMVILSTSSVGYSVGESTKEFNYDAKRAF